MNLVRIPFLILFIILKIIDPEKNGQPIDIIKF